MPEGDVKISYDVFTASQIQNAFKTIDPDHPNQETYIALAKAIQYEFERLTRDFGKIVN